MKGIAKEIIVITYSLVVTDERLEQEQERNKERGVRISDDKVRRTIIKERIIELIGDEKKKSSKRNDTTIWYINSPWLS